MSKKPQLESEMESFIIVKTVATTPARMMDRSYKKYITSLRADPDNAGYVKFGKSAESCTYPLNADDVQVTKVDLDKLFYYSENGTEKLHIWAEKAREL